MVRRIKTHHTADVIKGNRAPNDLDKQLVIDPTEVALISGGIVFEGRIVHINDDGYWSLGAGDTDLPWVLMNNSDDLDVTNDGGDPETEPDAWVAGTPEGEMKAVCVLNAAEFETTEFDSTLTYVPNDPLNAPISDSDPDNMLELAGVLTNASIAYGTDCVCGIVSEGRTPTSTRNANGRHSLKFIGYFLPVLP